MHVVLHVIQQAVLLVYCLMADAEPLAACVYKATNKNVGDVHATLTTSWPLAGSTRQAESSLTLHWRVCLLLGVATNRQGWLGPHAQAVLTGGRPVPAGTSHICLQARFPATAQASSMHCA